MAGGEVDSSRGDDISFAGFERLLVTPRTLLGLVGLPMLAVLSPSVWAPGLVLVGLGLVAVSAASRGSLRNCPSATGLRRLCMKTALADTVAAIAVWALLTPTGPAPGVILFPLLAFELTLKMGLLGAGGGAFLVVVGVVGRVAYRSGEFGLPPRPGLIAAMLGATGMLVGLALTVRTQQLAHQIAVAEKERIRVAFSEVLTAALSDVGVDQAELESAKFERMLDMACERSDIGRDVGRQLVKLLMPPSPLGGLTRREVEVLEQMKQGLSDAEIAARLYVARVTVRVHVSNILRKLGAASREEALAVAAGGAGRTKAPTADEAVARADQVVLRTAIGGDSVRAS